MEKDEEMVVIECDTHFLQTDVIEEEKVEKRVDETPVNVAEPAEKQSSSSHDDSHPSDVSYHLESDDSSEDNEEREATKEEKCVHGRKLIVYEEALDILFYSLRCNQCFAPVEDVEKVNVGILLRAKLYCVNGHQLLIWDSQAMLGGTPAGNLLVSAAILFSGNTFHKVGHFAKFLGPNFIGKSTYYNFQRDILNPVIYSAFKKQRRLSGEGS
ncbi:uncharacterized protein [Apostichopus japonicus]|uniref:uncharacterized protein n=1 Tax=Stichopus japonicus TaxID=307972 RepID=UPI003AB35F12